MCALALGALAQTPPALAHDLPVGGSRWCFGKSAIVANIDLNPSLLAQIQGVKEAGYPLEGMSDEQLSRLATEVLQPYIDAKLAVAQDGRKYRLKIDRIASNGDIYTLWLSVENVTIDPARPISIDYRLLFEETNRAHVNLAYGYVSDETGDRLQRVFDFSQPTMQNTFDFSTHVWRVMVGGPAVSSEPKAAANRGVVLERRGTPGIAPANRRERVPPPVVQGANAAPAGRPGVERAPEVRKSSTGELEGSPSERRGAAAGSAPIGSVVPSAWTNAFRFAVLGVEHILTGYDHIAFLLAVVVVGLSLREVLKTITAFTVAHSITLLLAALDVVRMSSRLVESAIALSICFVAFENLFSARVRHRWLVTFGFGLIHGFGFASALRELIVGRANVLASVVSFNVGVELGQVLILLAVLPVLRVLTRWVELRRLTLCASSLIFTLGLTWLVERALDVNVLARFG
jgi:hydrogenase/urease accessory protein HupE